MGCFSWCTSDTKKSIPCCMPFGDLPGTVYLLNPFGEPYKETDYEGYGEFGGRDVYELVVEWNRKYLTPENLTAPQLSDYAPGPMQYANFIRAGQNYLAACEAIKAYAAGASDDFMRENFGKVLGYGGMASEWKRCLGIKLACYDQDHVKLKYPIKITEHPMDYDKAGISPTCPFQGCFYPDSMRQIRQEVQEAFDDLAKEEAKWEAQKAQQAVRKPALNDQIQTAANRSADPEAAAKNNHLER